MPAGAGTTSRTVTADLDSEAPYQWRVRPEYQGTAGPWSARAAFVSPPSEGYIKGGELYDPLINGKTIGTIVGPVTFIPGVGVRLETFDSRIVYELPEPVEDGELSALVTNLSTNSEGGKTKIFSMAQGYGDLTVNSHRMTVEKRGDAPTGGIAWRFLTNAEDGVDTIGAERVVREFNPSLTYFWEADWRDGFFRVRINEGGVSGTQHLRFRQAVRGLLSAGAPCRVSRRRARPWRPGEPDGAGDGHPPGVGLPASAPGVRQQVTIERPLPVRSFGA